MRFTALLALAFLLVHTPLHAQATGQVTGRVLSQGGTPLNAAMVYAFSADGEARLAARTDVTGRFQLRGVAPGTYRLRAEMLGYRAAEQQVTVGAAGAVAAELRLEVSPVSLEAVVVSASRTEAPAATIPTSVRVVGQEALAEQARVGTGLNGVLANAVPGLAVGTGSSSLFGQSFRGRNVAVLIDGVPQSTGRNVMRDLETIDASAIERVEVLGGATSIYGDGATGGVINIITRRPAPGLRMSTSVALEGSPEAPRSSAGTRVVQSLSGSGGDTEYLFSGSWVTAGSFFDAEGDRIPADPQGQGGLADYRSLGLMAKIGHSLGERRAELSVHRYSGMQETQFTTDPTVNAVAPGDAKARAVGGLELNESVGSENLMMMASLQDPELFGGRFRGQLFFRDYLTRFAPFDGRSYLDHVAQSFVDSRKLGGRAEMETGLGFLRGGSAVWGLDYTAETSYQGLNVMDAALFDASGGRSFRKVGETKWVPEIDSRSVGAFAQFAWAPVERLSLRGGLRHERVRMHVDDFTTVTGNSVVGGDLDFRPLLFNVGAVLTAVPGTDLFASYAQGFSLADVGRVLRAAPAGFELGSRQLDAQLVDHYEAGVRGSWRRVQASAAVFRSESDLGTTFDAQLNVVRAPERIRGVEGTLDVQPTTRLAVGGTLTWSEGESYAAATDSWLALNGFRIQPLKATAYASHRTLPGWSNRLQLLHSGARDRAFQDGLTYGHLPIESYTVVDWTSALHVGPGRFDVGVHNLLDAQYFPVVSQLYAQWGNSSRAAARGRTVSIGYSVSY